MPTRPVHCLWSVAGAASLCVVMALIFGGCLVLRKVEIVTIQTSTTTTIFAIQGAIIVIGTLIFLYLYFTEKQEDHYGGETKGEHSSTVHPHCQAIKKFPPPALRDPVTSHSEFHETQIPTNKGSMSMSEFPFQKLNKDELLPGHLQPPKKRFSFIPKMHDYEDLYTLVCGTFLGVGAILYFIFLFYGQVSDNDKYTCTEKSSPAGAVFTILFVFVQLFFYLDPFKRRDRVLENLQHRADWTVVGLRYTLMAMLAGDICMWGYSVVAETYEDYCEVDYEYYSNHTYSKICHNSAHECYSRLVFSASEYLLPLVAEFGLFMVQEMMEWFRHTMNHMPCTCEPNPEDMSILRQGKWGIVAGIGIVILQFTSFLIYRITGNDEHAEIIDTLLLAMGFCVSMTIIWKINSLDLKVRNDAIHFEERVHLTIMILTYISTVFYFVISLYVYASSPKDSEHLRNILATLKNAIAPIDATFQFLVIWVITYKEARYVKQQNLLITLQIVLFAQNLAIWLSASYRYVHESHHLGDMIDYINGRLWVMSTHFALPMVIYFRFHLAETLNHFYT